MKYILSILLSFILAISLISCNIVRLTDDTTEQDTIVEPVKEEGKYIDGVYTAEDTDISNQNGFTDKIEITVEDGYITDVYFNGYNAEGKNKVDGSQIGGSYDMTIAGGILPWHEQAKLLEKYLIDNQDTAGIVMNNNGDSDTIAGVTIKVNSFVNVANKALESAKK